MGWNTTVVILNDGLHDIENDPEIGKKLAQAASRAFMGRNVSFGAGSHCNCIEVIETHHSDDLVPVLIGGNTGSVINTGGYIRWNDATPELTLLKQLAEKHGYRLSRKPVKKNAPGGT